MSRKIVITSGKGGVGKTTVTASLAYKLACKGERVVAVDGDLGLNNLDVCMGAEGRISYDIFDCMDGRCRVKQALVQSPWHSNLFLLPARFGKNRAQVSAQSFRDVMTELGRCFDYVLLDCPAGIDEGFRRAVAGADEAIVVITPHVSAIRDADKVVNLLTESQKMSVSIVVNKMRGDLSASGEILSPKEIASLINVRLIGVVPEDDRITCGLTSFHGASGRAFGLLADNVIKNRACIYDCEARYLGFFGSIRRRLKRIL